MPMLGGQDNGQRLQMLLQMLQQDEDRRRQQTVDLISKAQPGQTVEQLGIAPKRFKQVYGRTPTAGETILPETVQHFMEQKTLGVLSSAPAELVNALALSSRVRQDTGEGGITTKETLGTRIKTAGLEAQAKNIAAGTQVTNLQTINDLVEQAAADIKALPKPKKEGLAQKLAFGTTAAAEEAGVVDANLMTELKREALKFAAAPNTHPLGKMFKKRLGMDPTGVMVSSVIGTNSLLDAMAQLDITAASGRSALNTELAKAAGDLSKMTGFKINPMEVMAVWTEPDPAKRAQLGPIAALMETTAGIMGRAALTKAQMEGDPRMLTLQAVEAMARQRGDATLIQGISDMYRSTMADVLTEQRLGERPATVSPAQAQWDRVRQGFLNVAPGMIPGMRRTGPPGFRGIQAQTPENSPRTMVPTGTDVPDIPDQTQQIARPSVTPGVQTPTGSTKSISLKVPAGTTEAEIGVYQAILDQIMQPPQKKP